MTNLKVRRPPFIFDADNTPFLWQPRNPEFSMLCNATSFVAPAFERYIVATVSQAAPKLSGTTMAREADEFLRQEAQHARMHSRHVAALVEQYPALAETRDKVGRVFRELLDRETLEFGLAYIANTEATFSPIFSMVLNNESTLFQGGTECVASLFLWHFIEEIEHRSSAHAIYQTVVGHRWRRTAATPRTILHASRVMNTIFDDFIKHVPAPDRGNATNPLRLRSKVFCDIPRSQMCAMLWRLALTQMPLHRPERQPCPAFVTQWYDAEANGKDITRWYTTDSGPLKFHPSSRWRRQS